MKPDLSDPTTSSLLAAEAMARAGLAYALYGGLLLAAYGEPRRYFHRRCNHNQPWGRAVTCAS